MESSNQFDSNQTNGTKSTKKGLSAGWVVFIALATLILGGAIGYWYATTYVIVEETTVTVATESPTLSVSPTPSASPTTEADETADWKTYENESLGFSFKYPASFSITKDQLPSTRPANSLVIQDNSVNEEPTLTLWVDPDGFGPFFPDINYTVEFKNNKLSISSRDIVEVSSSNQDGKKLITLKSFDPNNHSYLIHFSYNEDGYDYEETFKTILSTFQFTN